MVFGAYGSAQRWIDNRWPITEEQKNSRRPRFDRLFAAGAWAGAVQCVVASPVELVKVKLQMQMDALPGQATTNYKGSWDCARQVSGSFCACNQVLL